MTIVEDFFTEFIDTENMDTELKKFYQVINEDDSDLQALVTKNKESYKKIDLDKLSVLPNDFKEIVDSIKKIYSFIIEDSLDSLDVNIINENTKKIDLLNNYIEQLENFLKKEIIELKKENNNRKDKIKKIKYESVTKETLYKILFNYNNLLSFGFTECNNVYEEYVYQLKIKKEINKIYRLINLEVDTLNYSIDMRQSLKDKLNKKITEINSKIEYLGDLIIEDSDYKNKLVEFKNYFNKLISFDDEDYNSIINVYNKLMNNSFINNKIESLENLFIKEREFFVKEEEFIYKKIGIKNINQSLDYISANYIDDLDIKHKKMIEDLYKEINEDKYNLIDIYEKIISLTNFLWKKQLTDVYSYVPGDDFNFICTNNQFLDEKHQSILITKRMLDIVNDYSDYQIGFICRFDDNILYITEEDDIMSVKHEDMSNVKTIKQIEQEFVNFKIRNRIALNGYKTSLCAVYLINDGDFIKYKKAVELSNQHSLPLVILRKELN